MYNTVCSVDIDNIEGHGQLRNWYCHQFGGIELIRSCNELAIHLSIDTHAHCRQCYMDTCKNSPQLYN